MTSSPQAAFTTMPVPDSSTQTRRVEGLTYQVVTVVAIVLLLGSLWLF